MPEDDPNCLQKVNYQQATKCANYRGRVKLRGVEIEKKNILSVNEKLPVSKFQYFGKYIIQLFGYCYVHVSDQRQAGLER